MSVRTGSRCAGHCPASGAGLCRCWPRRGNDPGWRARAGPSWGHRQTPGMRGRPPAGAPGRRRGTAEPGQGRAGARPSAGFREHRAVGGLLRGGGPRGFTRGHSYPPQRACFTSGTPKDGEFQGLLGGPKRCSVTAGTAAGCLQRRAIPPPDHSRRPGWAGTAEMRQAGARSRADSTSRGGGPGRGLRLLGARGAVSSSR